MRARRYRLHGLTVLSDLDLPAGAAERAVAPDLVIVNEPSVPIPAEPPAGRVLAAVDNDEGGRFSTTAVDEQGWTVVRFHGECEFRLSPDLSRLWCRAQPGVAPELVSIMAAGIVISTVLVLAGHLVLHASAVEHDGRAIAFVGASGMGKSTLASLMCAAGWRFVSDDVLRVDGPVCFRGATEARLRAPDDNLAPSLAQRVRPTADGRWAVPLEPCPVDTLPLGDVLVPVFERGRDDVVVERVTGLRAALGLARFPRVRGWRDPGSAQRQFELTADLVASVPIWRLQLPWGLAGSPGLVDQVLQGIKRQ